MEAATKIPSNASAALRSGEFGYPTGHLGHLTAAQESALVDFKKLCTDAKLYNPGSGDNPPSHRDAVLLRYLRARRFVPKDALQQFRDTEKWRRVNEIDELYANIDLDNYDEARRLYPQWIGRRDKRGMPLYLFEVKSLDSKTMAAYAKSSTTTAVVSSSASSNTTQKEKDLKSKPHTNSKVPSDESEKTPPRLLRLFALYENLSGFMSELCTVLNDRPYSETPVVQSNNIVDITGVGLKQFWNLRAHMQDASVLATAHYPETLDRIFIVGAPSFFPTVWSWIKRWFDPITVSKIFILSSTDVFPTLSKFIDPESIPRKFGGTLDYEFGQLAPVDPAYADKITWKYPVEEETQPNLGAKAKSKKRSKDTSGKRASIDRQVSMNSTSAPVRRWPRGPVRWVERSDGDMDLLAVGSEGGKLRREVVATLHLDDEIGGSADPAGPLQNNPRHKHSSKGAETQANGTEKAQPNGAVMEGSTDVPPVAAANGQPPASVEPDSKLMGDLKIAQQPEVMPEASPATAEVATAAAVDSSAASGLPAVEPIPLDAVATALPGDNKAEVKAA